jgi:hypothetical protein
VEEWDYGPQERMVTGESGQRAAAMMVGEVDRRETADAVKRFRMELRDAAESHERWGTVFGTGWGGSHKISRVIRALKLGACTEA